MYYYQITRSHCYIKGSNDMHVSSSSISKHKSTARKKNLRLINKEIICDFLRAEHKAL